MIGWRLCRRPHADLDGEGARRFGGRWNSAGRPVVYLTAHPALATLEVPAHLDLPLDLLPTDYVLVQVRLPGTPLILAATDATAASGDAWLSEAASPTVRVASILVPHAWKILLNPRHPEASRAEILSVEPFRFDPRLWRPLAGEGEAPGVTAQMRD